MTNLMASRPESIDRRGGKLAREIDFPGVIFFSITGIGLFVSLQLPFTMVLGIWPGINLLAVVAIGAVVSLMYAFTYASIGAAIRRPGADYVLASRTTNASLAFASSWSFVVFSALFTGLLVAWVSQTIFPVLIQSFGIISNNENYLNLAATLATPQVVALVGTTIVVAAFGLTAVPPRFLNIIFQIGIMAALIGFLFLSIQLGLPAADAFPAAWDRFMGVGGFETRVELAKSLGMTLNGDARTVVAAGSIAGVWMFFGSIYPAISASEVKRPGKNLFLGSWTAIGLAWLIFSLVILLLQRLVPVEWLSAESYLSFHVEQGQAMPWITFYAAILQVSPFFIFLIGAIWVYSIINLIQIFLFSTSRIILAWAEDGLMPKAFSYVHPGMRTPLVAMFFVAVAALIGMIYYSQGVGTQPYLTFIFYIAVPQIIPVLAAIVFPFIRKDWFHRADGIARWKIGPIPLMSLASLGTLAYLIWLVILVVIRPHRGPNIEQGFLIAPILVFLCGYVWYHLRRRNGRIDETEWRAKFQRLPGSRTEAEGE